MSQWPGLPSGDAHCLRWSGSLFASVSGVGIGIGIGIGIAPVHSRVHRHWLPNALRASHVEGPRNRLPIDTDTDTDSRPRTAEVRVPPLFEVAFFFSTEVPRTRRIQRCPRFNCHNPSSLRRFPDPCPSVANTASTFNYLESCIAFAPSVCSLRRSVAPSLPPPSLPLPHTTVTICPSRRP